MGCADVVPGVSGGTIAFIAGIYEELITSINNINIKALNVLRKEGIAAFWRQVNGNFFVALLGGIAAAVISLAKIITYLLDHEPVLIWSFFFGLVFMSIYFVARRVNKWQTSRYIAFALGAILAYWITTLPAQAESSALWYIFISGMIAICAMILPGISGSFILLLMGSYTVVLNGIHERQYLLIITFMAGAAIGLLSFSRLLKFMFDRYHDVTIALLSGFLLGSLNKIWPWKELTNPVFVKDKTIYLEYNNLLPNTYTEITANASHLGWAIMLFAFGMLLIFLLEKLAGHKQES